VVGLGRLLEIFPAVRSAVGFPLGRWACPPDGGTILDARPTLPGNGEDQLDSDEAGTGTAGQSAGLAQHRAEIDQATRMLESNSALASCRLLSGCVPTRMLIAGCDRSGARNRGPPGEPSPDTNFPPEGRT
jgi:hypothetical protein